MHIPGTKPAAADDVAEPGADQDIAEPELVEPELTDQFLAEADSHERSGRHAEAGVLRDVVERLLGAEAEDNGAEAG